MTVECWRPIRYFPPSFFIMCLCFSVHTWYECIDDDDWKLKRKKSENINWQQFWNVCRICFEWLSMCLCGVHDSCAGQWIYSICAYNVRLLRPHNFLFANAAICDTSPFHSIFYILYIFAMRSHCSSLHLFESIAICGSTSDGICSFICGHYPMNTLGMGMKRCVVYRRHTALACNHDTRT